MVCHNVIVDMSIVQSNVHTWRASRQQAAPVAGERCLAADHSHEPEPCMDASTPTWFSHGKCRPSGMSPRQPPSARVSCRSGVVFLLQRCCWLPGAALRLRPLPVWSVSRSGSRRPSPSSGNHHHRGPGGAGGECSARQSRRRAVAAAGRQ